jgi:exodeoxyribonuclease VII large subunit
MAAPETFTVRELNELIRGALGITFPDPVWVEGDIGSLKRHAPSGNVYFELVDADASGRVVGAVPVVLLRANKAAVNHALRRAGPPRTAEVEADGGAAPRADRAGSGLRMVDGVRVRIRAEIDYLVVQGRLQLRMVGIDPAFTLQRLTSERDRVLGALVADGSAAANGALAFPALPAHLGLVTSRGSAAAADFLDELALGGVGWRVCLVHTRVQGRDAEIELAAALATAAARGVEVIAVVRGGGSRIDLLPFDTELLARAIATTPVPVVTGIGHEIDTSVADLVAARAYKTPTACAAALTDHVRAALGRADDTWRAIGRHAGTLLTREDRRLTTVGHHVTATARGRLELADQRAAHADARLRRTGPAGLDSAVRRLATAEARAAALDPQRTLARGWSITRTGDGRLVTAADQPDGTLLVTTLADGELRSRVTGDAGPARRAPSDDGHGVEPPEPPRLPGP